MDSVLQRWALLTILLALAFPLASCDSGGSDDGGSTDALIPLGDGNQWVVEVTDGSFQGSATFEVVETDSVKGRLRIEDDFGEMANLQVLDLSSGLLLGYRGDVAFLKSEKDDLMLLKFPVEEGETYQHTDGDGVTYKVSVSKTATSVPAGDFEDCLEYTFRYVDSTDVQSTLTVKPGVGPLRWEGELLTRGGEPLYLEAELISTNASADE